MNLSVVHEILRREIGLDPTAAGDGPIAAAVRARMAARGLTTTGRFDDYVDLLRSSGEELVALIDHVVIPESWFLRDRVPFDFLADKVSEWLAHRPLPAIVRVLSLPCAGGEEPYSVAIRLQQAGIDRRRVEITGVDVSPRAIARARRAIYTSNALRNEEVGIRETFFTPTHEGLALRPAIVTGVRFLVGNLLDSLLLANESGTFDAVMCRNVLIYLDAEARSRALQTLDRLLAPNGVLFLGHAEPVTVMSKAFRHVGPRSAFAYERAVVPPNQLACATGSQAVSRTSPTPSTIPSGRTREATRHPSSAYPAKTRRTPDPSTPAQPSSVSPTAQIEQAALLAGEGRLDEAASLCERDLATRGPTASAFALLGIVRQAQGNRAAAEALLQKAVYLDANHEEALLGLAALAQRRGDAAAAANYRRRAERAYRENCPAIEREPRP